MCLGVITISISTAASSSGITMIIVQERKALWLFQQLIAQDILSVRLLMSQRKCRSYLNYSGFDLSPIGSPASSCKSKKNDCSSLTFVPLIRVLRQRFMVEKMYKYHIKVFKIAPVAFCSCTKIQVDMFAETTSLPLHCKNHSESIWFQGFSFLNVNAEYYTRTGLQKKRLKPSTVGAKTENLFLTGGEH